VSLSGVASGLPDTPRDSISRAPSRRVRPRLQAAGHHWLLVVTTVSAAAMVGALGAQHAIVFAAIAALIGGAAVCVLAHFRPATALTGAFFLLPIAATKFRSRPATASMAGEVDAQIIFELVLYAMIGLVSVAASSARVFQWRRPTVAEMLLAAYTLMAMASALWSATPLLSVVRGGQLAALLLLCVVAVRVMGTGGVIDRVSEVVVPYVLICASMAALFPWAANHVSTGVPIGRFSWFYVHPITAASFAGVAGLSVYVKTMYGARPRSFARTFRSMLVMVLLLAILALTRSRGPMIAVAIAVGLLIARRRVPRWLMAMALAAGLVIAALYVNAATPWTEWMRAHSDAPLLQFLLRGQGVEDVVDFSGRGELWKGATRLFTARPLLGYGYGGARGLLLDALPWAGDAHNGVIQTLLDVGLIGSIPLWLALMRAFITALVSCGKPIGSRSYASVAVLAFLAFVLVNSVTDVGFAEPGYPFVLAVTCVLAAEWMRDARGARAAI